MERAEGRAGVEVELAGEVLLARRRERLQEDRADGVDPAVEAAEPRDGLGRGGRQGGLRPGVRDEGARGPRPPREGVQLRDALGEPRLVPRHEEDVPPLAHDPAGHLAPDSAGSPGDDDRLPESLMRLSTPRPRGRTAPAAGGRASGGPATRPASSTRGS